jgi:hypothetical protein
MGVFAKPHRGAFVSCLALVALSAGFAAGCNNGPTPDEARARYGFTVMTANLVEEMPNGPGATAHVAWRDRYDRIPRDLLPVGIAGELGAPDIIALQEVHVYKTACAFSPTHAEDDESLLYLVSALRATLGINYRIASVTATQAPQDFGCVLRGGSATLYNASRLRNLTLQPGQTTVAATDDTTLGFQYRASHPCSSSTPQANLCGLIDGPTFTTVYQQTGTGSPRLGPTLSVFEFVDFPGPQLHVYNDHEGFLKGQNAPIDPASLATTTTTVDEGERRFPAERLYPPVMAGDFNLGLIRMTAEMAQGYGPFTRFRIGVHYSDPIGEPEGILSGHPGAFPARYDLKLELGRTVHDITPPPGAPPQPRCPPQPSQLWSDHCAIFARYAPG